jgi:hypothetical protein
MIFMKIFEMMWANPQKSQVLKERGKADFSLGALLPTFHDVPRIGAMDFHGRWFGY